jgi:hypothetical protein
MIARTSIRFKREGGGAAQLNILRGEKKPSLDSAARHRHDLWVTLDGNILTRRN